MATNECVTNGSADDGTLCAATLIRRIFWSRRLAVEFCARILFLLRPTIFLVLYDSISTWYNIGDTKAAG